MNGLVKFGYRVYQRVFYLAMFFLPWRKPEMVKGEGSLLKLPKMIKDSGYKSVLLVTDSVLMGLGVVNPLIEGLKENNIKVALYDKVVPNPTIDLIEEALKMYHENSCEAIIAFGGGSPMDCAKGIGARVARPDKPISKMKGQLKVLKKLPTLYAIPTTSGTGSEATLAAVISNPETHEKYPINDPVLIPKFAILDPTLTIGLPPHITSTTGMDALTHAVEAFIGSSNTKETKEEAIKATQLIFKYLERAYKDGKDIEARENMQEASLLAGMAFTRAYVGYVHALAHALGGFYGVPHGLANSVLLPYVLEAYGSSVYKKLAILADAVGITGANDEEKAKAFIQEIKKMNANMAIPTKIEGKWTIKDEDIPKMVERALSEGNPLYPVPKIFGKEELTALYKQVQ